MLSVIIIWYSKVRRRIKMLVLRPAFSSRGNNFIFDPYGTYTYHNIKVGDDVFIGQNAFMSATMSTITIGDKVMLGPNVTMITGDHNSSMVGEYMKDVSAKLDKNDQPILIKNDVWVGAGVIILKGVTVGEGSIIAAGSLVREDIMPNSIVAGVPAKKIKDRFTTEELKQHYKMLYQG